MYLFGEDNAIQEHVYDPMPRITDVVLYSRGERPWQVL